MEYKTLEAKMVDKIESDILSATACICYYTDEEKNPEEVGKLQNKILDLSRLRNILTGMYPV